MIDSLEQASYTEMPYAKAVSTFGIHSLPRPVEDVVRVTEAPLAVAQVDTDELDFWGGWVFLNGLEVAEDFVTGMSGDGNLEVAICGAFHAKRIWLSGASLTISKNATIEHLIVTSYNHGLLRVQGWTNAPLVLIEDHDTAFVGGLDGMIIDSKDRMNEALHAECLVDGEVDLGLVWSRSRAGLPLVPSG